MSKRRKMRLNQKRLFLRKTQKLLAERAPRNIRSISMRGYVTPVSVFVFGELQARETSSFCIFLITSCDSPYFLSLGGGGHFHTYAYIRDMPRERPQFSAQNYRSRTHHFHKLQKYSAPESPDHHHFSAARQTPPPPPPRSGCDFLYRRMASEARGDLFVKATCLENSDSIFDFISDGHKVLCT